MQTPDGLTLYNPRGRDRLEDLNQLADCIANSSACLFNDGGGSVVWIHGGKRIDVALDVLATIVAKYIVTARPVNHGGKWTVAFDPVRPDQTTLLALLRGEDGLARHLPKSKPTGLTLQQ